MAAAAAAQRAGTNICFANFKLCSYLSWAKMGGSLGDALVICFHTGLSEFEVWIVLVQPDWLNLMTIMHSTGLSTSSRLRENWTLTSQRGDLLPCASQ